MTIINRYFQREILSPFCATLGALVFILLLGQLFKIVNMVVSEGVRFYDVLRLVAAMIPQLLTMALPISFFFAVLVGVGRLVGDGEIIAMKAAGISPVRMLSPILKLAAAATLVTMLVSVWVAPWGMRQARQVTFEILQEKVTLALRPYSLNLSFPGMAIYIGDIDRASGRVKDVFIEDQRQHKHPQAITASAGRIVGDRRTSTLLLELYDGTIHEFNPKNESYRVTDFTSYRVNFDIASLLGEKGRIRLRNQAMTNAELRRKIELRLKAGRSAAGARANLYERFTKPFSCIAFALLGLALSLSPVRSGASFKGFVSGLMVILLYYLSGLVTEYLAEWLPSAALFFFCLPNLVFFALGAVLLYLKQQEAEVNPGLDPLLAGVKKLLSPRSLSRKGL